ncbi:MAG: 50S ribosomal protein L29 [Acetobacteraceae bacterium]|nr:50S ribosomal protein L29 [Acetobacteraceae bacterium]MBV9776324.1 50S ribosomal protein L29 [Acetobacteraceae bacterium]
MAKGVNTASDLRAKTPDELDDLLVALRREQFNLRFQRATGQAEGVARVRQVRRDIARLKTIVGERRRASARTERGT